MRKRVEKVEREREREEDTDALCLEKQTPIGRLKLST